MPARPIFVVAVAIALACPAAAQFDRSVGREFLPLEVGNEWLYSYKRTDCDRISLGGQCTGLDTTLTFRVTGSEVRGADTLAVIENGAWKVLFGHRDSETLWFTEVLEEGDRRVPAIPPFPAPGAFSVSASDQAETRDVSVGGILYSGDALVRFVQRPTYVVLRGVGLTESSDRYQQSGGARGTRQWTLRAATIADRNYGRFVTSFDPVLEGAASTAAAFPNPTSSRSTVRIEAATPGVLEVDVFDVLGRKIWTTRRTVAGGTHDLEVALENEPSGVYLIRSVLEGALLTPVRVTKR